MKLNKVDVINYCGIWNDVILESDLSLSNFEQTDLKIITLQCSYITPKVLFELIYKPVETSSEWRTWLFFKVFWLLSNLLNLILVYRINAQPWRRSVITMSCCTMGSRALRWWLKGTCLKLFVGYVVSLERCIWMMEMKRIAVVIQR